MAESINLYDSIYTLRDTRNRLKLALIRLGMLEGDWHEEEQLGDRTDGGFSLLDCRDAINNMGGDATLTNRTRMNVATKKRVKAYDANLIASNIKKGVTILGVTGSYGGSGSTQTPRPYIWKYGTATAPSTTPSGKYSKLIPKMAADSSLTLRPENIAKGVDIMGVIGTYDYMHMCGLHGYTAATSATRYEVNLESLPYCPYSGYNTITEQNIKTGWITTNGRFDLNSDYFTDGVRYIVGAKFGKNIYNHDFMFLVLDTLTYVTYVSNNWNGWTTRYERYYVNDPSSVLRVRHNSSTSFPTLVIDLSGATYKLFDSNAPSGSNVDIDIRFLTSADFEHMASAGGSPSGGTRQYHADIRW